MRVKKANVHIRLDERLWKWVRIQAARKGREPNDVIAEAIEIMRNPDGKNGNRPTTERSS